MKKRILFGCKNCGKATTTTNPANRKTGLCYKCRMRRAAENDA